MMQLEYASTLAGFLGNIAVLMAQNEISRKAMISAVVFGIFVSYSIPPLLVSYLISDSQMHWLPANGELLLSVLIGGLVGGLSMHLIGALIHIGEKFKRDPVAFVKNRGDVKDE